MTREDSGERAHAREGRMRCEEIQRVLFDYMARELGKGRSDLVRVHLRKCERCQAAAAEMQETIDFLKQASRHGPHAPDRLTDDRRRKLRWVFTHPVLDWIYAHHVLVSIIVAAAVITAALCILRNVRLWWVTPPEEGVPVMISEEPPSE